MAMKPTYINLPQRPNDIASRLGLPSPRLQHFDGDVPPSLSPLDAFAAQSRALAQQLDDEQRQGRRMSRLPPAMVKKSLSLPRSDRPGFDRSTSGGDMSIASSYQDEQSVAGTPGIDEPEVGHPAVEQSRFRPVSEYPRISGIPLEFEEDEEFMTPMETTTVTQNGLHQNSHPPDYFGTVPRAGSPEPIVLQDIPDDQALRTVSQNTEPFPTVPVKKTSGDSYSQRMHALSNSQRPHIPFGRPPRLRHESSDDGYTSSNAGSTFSETRKLSESSGISAPHSPISPFITNHPRSPSINSEVSVGGTRLPRPAFNFSRPLSSASLQYRPESPRVSQDIPRDAVKPADAEYPTTPLSMDDAQSISSDGYYSGNGTYTHAMYSLPRGRMVSRNSVVFQGLSTPHFEWSEPLFQPPGPATPTAKPSAPTSAPQGSASQPEFAFSFDGSRPKTPENKTIEAKEKSSPASSFHSATSTAGPRPSVEHGDLRNLRGRPPLVPLKDDNSSRSASTIRPQSFRTNSTTHTYMSPEDHVQKAIECHENGSLQESTYHLRLAALQNHPTAMLLYALACRHGWGMRANEREGVQWLRKAVDCAGSEIAEDEDPSSVQGPRDLQERKVHKAQMALSIYELGVSHLNGWGTDKDKGLALRCFEIAGNWGDPDALAEAGFCYAEGIGCKKDLKKAAKLYRAAEAKGISMVGNSWIYKDKYNEKNERSTRQSASTGSPEKARGKSRTRSRSIFSRKKSYQP